MERRHSVHNRKTARRSACAYLACTYPRIAWAVGNCGTAAAGIGVGRVVLASPGFESGQCELPDCVPG
jgi:hypothetical protein